MGVQWVLASVTVALVAAGTGGAVLLTSGPLGDDSQTETLQQPPVSGELNRQKDPEGTASDSENERAREAALADREIADWLSSRGDWNLLWVDLYDISDDKDQSCSPGPCVEVVFYSWKAARALTAVLDLESGRTLASPVELRAPRLTQQLKDEAASLALADPVVQQAVGATLRTSNVADFDGYGVCGDHLCALVGVFSPDKPTVDRTNGAGVEVDLVTNRVVYIADHTGVLKDER